VHGYKGTVSADNVEKAAWMVVNIHNRDDRPDGHLAPSFSAGDVVRLTAEDGKVTDFASTGYSLETVTHDAKVIVTAARDVLDVYVAARNVTDKIFAKQDYAEAMSDLKEAITTSGVVGADLWALGVKVFREMKDW
jgi:hypothetical protein